MSFFHLLNKQMYIFLDCPVKTKKCNHDIVTTCLVTLNSVVIMLCAYFLFPSIFDFFFSSIVNFFQPQSASYYILSSVQTNCDSMCVYTFGLQVVQLGNPCID